MQNTKQENLLNEDKLFKKNSQFGASDSVTDLSILSITADAHNVSCLGLCGWDICRKSST